MASLAYPCGLAAVRVVLATERQKAAAAIRRWEPLVRDFTNACVNDVIESGRLDFVDDIANIVPAVLTMAILGLPLADWVIYCEPTHAMVYAPPDSPDLLRVSRHRWRW